MSLVWAVESAQDSHTLATWAHTWWIQGLFAKQKQLFKVAALLDVDSMLPILQSLFEDPMGSSHWPPLGGLGKLRNLYLQPSRASRATWYAPFSDSPHLYTAGLLGRPVLQRTVGFYRESDAQDAPRPNLRKQQGPLWDESWTSTLCPLLTQRAQILDVEVLFEVRDYKHSQKLSTKQHYLAWKILYICEVSIYRSHIPVVWSSHMAVCSKPRYPGEHLKNL